MSALSNRLAEAKGDRSIDAVVAQAESRGHKIDRATVAGYVAGTRGAKRPMDHVLRALAAGLDVDVRELRQLAGLPRGELGPWQPPDEANRLSSDQRDALSQLIKTMVAAPMASVEWASSPYPFSAEEGALRDLPNAARRGRRTRATTDAAQNRAGEERDPEGPEGGA